jgi:uncharacterized protein (TIGR02453 family)
VAAFKGWPAEAFDFYEGLEADNTKAYWTAHKATYEECVRAPFEALLTDLAAEFGPGKLFRPYRDVRFAADKAPYKTNAGAVLNHTDGPVYYVAISTEGLFAASGYYMMAKDQIDRFRKAVADAKLGPAVERVVTKLEQAGYDIGGEALKRSPPGYPVDHPRIRLLRHKGLTMAKGWPPAAWMGTAKAKPRVVEVFRAAKPLNAWLDANVGPSDMPREAR